MELDNRALCYYKSELAIRLEFAETTTRAAIRDFADTFHLSEGACITLFDHLIATKVLKMNLLEAFNMDRVNPIMINYTVVFTDLGNT